MQRGPALTASQLRNALTALARRLPPDKPADMTLIGGGAGMLSELLPEGRTTVDVDVIEVTPPEVRPEVFDLCCYHAPAIAEECGISPKWFDAAPFNLRHMMLSGWRDRTTRVGDFGPLRVRAIARIDLIALKAIASRQRDMQDLLCLAVTAEEAAFVIGSIPKILEQGTNPDLVEKAIETMRLFLRNEDGGGDATR